MKWYTVKWVGQNYILSTVIEAENPELAGEYASADLNYGWGGASEALRNATVLIEEVAQ